MTWPIIRNVFLKLRDVNFITVPKQLARTCKQLASGPGTTAINEHGNKVLRDAETKKQAQRLWHPNVSKSFDANFSPSELNLL